MHNSMALIVLQPERLQTHLSTQFEKRSSFIRKWRIEVRLYACMHVNLLYKFAIFKWDNNPAQETLRPTRIAFGSS